jgi:hypothetical protein
MDGCDAPLLPFYMSFSPWRHGDRRQNPILDGAGVGSVARRADSVASPRKESPLHGPRVLRWLHPPRGRVRKNRTGETNSVWSCGCSRGHRRRASTGKYLLAARPCPLTHNPSARPGRAVLGDVGPWAEWPTGVPPLALRRRSQRGPTSWPTARRSPHSDAETAARELGTVARFAQAHILPRSPNLT